MKKFTLGCEHDHEFEGWFADAEAIQQQIGQGLLDCPYCGSTTLEKRLSAPNLSTPKTKARIAAEQASTSGPASAPPQSAPESGPCAATGRFNGRAACRGRNSGPAHGGAGPASENSG